MNINHFYNIIETKVRTKGGSASFTPDRHIFFGGKTTKKDNPLQVVFSIAWQRPTLTGTFVPTTIGAEKLNFRVRYGNGCDLLAIITRLFY
jgi:hypothetical protein